MKPLFAVVLFYSAVRGRVGIGGYRTDECAYYVLMFEEIRSKCDDLDISVVF